MSSYRFPGIWPFINAVAKATGRSAEQSAAARQIKQLARIQDSLGQVGAVNPESREVVLAEAVRIRDCLALALEGADAAILDVATALELRVPCYFSLLPEPDGKPAKSSRRAMPEKERL